MRERIYLSPPHQSGLERERVEDALASNWIAPLGPNVDAFEEELREGGMLPRGVPELRNGRALHLALILIA